MGPRREGDSWAQSYRVKGNGEDNPRTLTGTPAPTLFPGYTDLILRLPTQL